MVIDTDGSAFITKAEFDSLKNNFQAQIDSYNSSIDSKIDFAISTYLSGVRMIKETSLNLDKVNSYIFPLRYDNNENWNNPDSVWYALSRPSWSTKKMIIQIYMGSIYSSAGAQPWNIKYNDYTNGVFTLASPSGAIPDTYQWSIKETTEQVINVPNLDGFFYDVERNSSSRSIDLGSGNQEYNTFKILNKGKGSQKIMTDNAVSFDAIVSGSGNIKYQTSINCYSYYQFFLCQANVRNQTLSQSSEYWTPKHLVSKQAGYVNVLRQFNQGEYLSLAQIKNRGNQNAPFAGSVTLLDENSYIVYKANDFVDNNVNYIFGHGANIPANILGSWKYMGKVNTSASVTQFLSMANSLPKVLSCWGWTFYNTTNFATLLACHNYWLPRLYAPDNESYDCNETDYFSKLPSTLVTYNDSEGKQHYIDEGMFLGNMKVKGDIKFTINFQRDTGSGSKVVLHISKKPFSYNFNNADLLEYKINNILGKEQQLDYGTEYTVEVPDIQVDEQLYMEWLPVTIGDMSSLESFTNYKCVSEE